MFQDVDAFDHHEQALFSALDSALQDGLGSPTGRSAYHRAMAALDTLIEDREARLYTPLAADPLTRDYIARLDGQIHGVSGRIDILRTHIELGLLPDSENCTDLDASLARLVSQLRARFRREAALIPVYAGWLDRSASMAEEAA